MSAISSVANSGNVLIDSLAWGSKWSTPGAAQTTISVGYLSSGATPSAAELAAMQKTMALYAAVINVRFVWVGATDAAGADLAFNLSDDPSAQLGRADAPGERMIDGAPHSEVTIYRANYAREGGALASGGYDLVTYIHEFGHALGLAHPHDDGGTANDLSARFPGVTASTGDYGDGNLNQGIFTTMSYNDGWATRTLQPLNMSYGLQAGPMALDIMALQYIYGAKSDHNSGNTSYVLQSANLAGTGYSCIWDTGGIDTIRQAGSASAIIDLRSATGLVAVGGGGFVSCASNIAGGFTIAKGTIIENAVGGSGDDILRGNGAANLLQGNQGRDHLVGFGGRDVFVFNKINDSAPSFSGADCILDFMPGSDRIFLEYIDARERAGGTQDFSFIGYKSAFTGEGQVRCVISSGSTYVLLNTDADAAAESVIRLAGSKLLTLGDFIF